MTAPPGLAPHTVPTGSPNPETAANQAASAIRRAGFDPTPRNIRVVLRADRTARRDSDAYQPTSDDDFGWWDRLVSAMPHELCRQRKVARHEFGARR